MSYRVSSAFAALALLLAPVAASAQFNSSDGYKFLEAVRKADGAKVAEILGKPGATIVNTRDHDTGQTGLYIAANREDSTYVLFLLQHQANPNLGDNQGVTPLMVAVQRGFDDGVSTLIAHGALVNQANNRGETALILAVQTHNLNLVRYLLDHGANPDKPDIIAGMSARDYARNDTRFPAIAKELEKARKTGDSDRAVSGPRLH